MLVRPVSIDKVLSAIVNETKKIFGFTRAAIFIVNHQKRILQAKYVSLPGFNAEEMERASTRPLHLDKHTCSETLVANTGQTIYIADRRNDPRSTRIDLKMDLFWKRVTTIGAPLGIERDIIGVLEGDSTSRVLQLSENEIDLFTFFAKQASIIIENARFQEQNQNKIDQLLLLHEVTRNSTSILDIGELINNLATGAIRLTRAKSSLIFLCAEGATHLECVGGSGETVPAKTLVTVGDGIVGRVVATGRPRLVHDLWKESQSNGPDPESRSQLVTPITYENKVLGAVSVYSDQTFAFTGTDLEILSIMASHAAGLFEKAALYDQLSMEKDRAENILESSPNGIIMISGDGFIQSINSKAEQILETDRESVLRKSISEIGDDRIETMLNTALRKQPQGSRIQERLVKKAGEDCILEIGTSLVKRIDGESAEIMILLRDITEEKKTEEIMRRMDRMSSLGQLSAGIAHEIRNPLSGINLNLQMLARQLKADPESTEKISDSLEGIVRINGLIKNVLNFARPTPPNFKWDFLQRVIKETLSIMASQLKRQKIRVIKKLPVAGPAIFFDENQMRQVFVNLLVNAMEAMPDGGTIKITGSVETNGSRLGLFRLIISDNGSGIPEDILSKIFDPFFTTKPEGTGLGLSILHQILEQHRAIIQVESSVGKGAVFTLSFPIRVDEAQNV